MGNFKKINNDSYTTVEMYYSTIEESAPKGPSGTISEITSGTFLKRNYFSICKLQKDYWHWSLQKHLMKNTAFFATVSVTV